MIEQLRQGRWILLAAVVLIGGGLLFSQLQRDALPEHPLGLAPEGAEIIASLDVAAVLSSHLFDVLLEEDTDGDVRRVEETCGYDPLQEVDRALVFSMGTDRPFEQLGFVARGELARGRAHRQRLVECVRSVLSGRGGGVSSTEVEGLSAVASVRGDSVATFFGEDAVLGGDRALVAQTVRVARGQAASAVTDSDLRAVFDRLRASDLVVVGRLPDAWLPAMMQMASGLDPSVGALLTVRTLGLGARLQGGVELRLVLRSTDADAGAIADVVTAQGAEVLRDLRVRLSVVGTVLRAMQVERAGPDVVIQVRATDDQVDALRELWTELGAEGTEPLTP
ncbi:MAG: hypothetical protein AB8I08_40610 [Sandaracinaceae bacterium]